MDRRQLFIAGAVGSVGAATLAPQAATAAPAAGFNSTFNTHKNGWSNAYGSWQLNRGMLHCDGISRYWTSVKRAGIYDDFTYEARMRRSGNYGGHSANNLVIRGNPNRMRSSDKGWCPSYLMQYTNNGAYSVWKITPGGRSMPVANWTFLDEKLNGFVTIKVLASGDYLALALNGTWVWSGIDSSYSVGQVGISFHTQPGYWGKLDVDWARLSVGSRSERPVVTRQGTPLRGGSVTTAPH